MLVYIPGLDGTGQLFFKQSPYLDEDYRVVSIRLRDHGRFTYEDLADDVAAAIRQRGEERATVAAESFGGGVALTFALRYPQMVERLVIVNSFPRYRQRARIELGAWLAARIPFSLAWPVRKFASLIGLFVDCVPAEDRRHFFQATRTITGEAYARRLQLIAELDIEDRLSEITAPTLLIGCKKDLLVRSVSEAHLMAARMPHAQVKIFRDAGHACLLGDRVRLADVMKEWIEGQLSRV
jgi:pimeloyl-ACP methyl ester carboxylesterase